jgi:hypothetical protein
VAQLTICGASKEKTSVKDQRIDILIDIFYLVRHKAFFMHLLFVCQVGGAAVWRSKKKEIKKLY